MPRVTNLVSWHTPSSFAYKLSCALVNIRPGSDDFVLSVHKRTSVNSPLAKLPGIRYESGTYHCQIVKRPCSLNILQGFIQVPQLRINSSLGLLSTLHSLRLESLDRFQLPVDIVCSWLELLEMLLDLVYDCGVLEGLAVVLEVNSLRQVAKLVESSSRVVVTLLESGKSSGGLPL